eukprot:COSAG04_NODE_1692_length_5913_cov_7.400241_2_plen_73_part_00
MPQVETQFFLSSEVAEEVNEGRSICEQQTECSFVVTHTHTLHSFLLYLKILFPKQLTVVHLAWSRGLAAEEG